MEEGGMTDERVKRIAEALGDVAVFDKHQIGEVVTITLRGLLEDVRSFDPISVEEVLDKMARRAIETYERD
jgi:uncharacterized protein with von Willebrand factor type A (vWA) domain